MNNRISRVALTLAVWCLCSVASAAVVDEFKIKREAAFTFAKKPAVTREGDKISIAFETKGLCDVTVAIEDAKGGIIRHLASGVLGPNAPAPLQKNSKKQILTWDGKNDQDIYADNKEELTVRVSLGLKPQFERTLFHSPYKRFGRNQPVMTAAPEGVYVYEGDITDNIQLYDHDGAYVRTVYPFPHDKLEQVKGLRWQTTVDGVKVPLKEGSHQATFFGSGYNGGYNAETGYGQYQLKTLKAYDGLPSDPAAAAMAVRGNRLALVGFYLNRLATDGSSGGLNFKGQKTGIQVTPQYIYGNGPKNMEDMPRSAAFSPDGKWLYLTGYTWYEDRSTGGATRRWLHGVLRVSFDTDAKPTVFVGSMKQDDAMAGTGNDKLNAPTSVACDPQGRVYVGDYVNNRVQVFTPDGKFVETVPVERPAHVAVHQKTGELYVFSWTYSHSGIIRHQQIHPKLTTFGETGNRKKIAEYKLPVARGPGSQPWGGWMGIQYRVELDSWTEPPTVWLVPDQAGGGQSWAPWGLKLLAVEKNKLTVKKDFGKETLKGITCDVPSSGRQRLSLNPKSGKVYILSGMGTASGDRVIEVDPVKNKDRYVDLPFGAEDICFDINGLAYLRTGEMVVRYDSRTWREVPWDYGEERNAVSHCGGRSARVISGLPVPGTRPGPWFHCGGFGISPKGHLVVQCFNGGSQGNTKLDRPDEPKVAATAGKPYEPTIYPGRQRWGEIHVWDAHGKVVSEDVVPGITITDGVCIDRDDNIYLLANPVRTPGGKQLLNPMTETLMKFKPGKGRVISSGNDVPVPLNPKQTLDRPTDMYGTFQSPSWVEGAEWLYGGVGYAGTWRCTCWNARFALDYYARSFAPEPDRFSVAVLDTAGNLITRIGQYGNIDDGRPLIPDPAIKGTRPIGGDETAIMHACYVAVHTDKRLLIEDQGNRRIASVKLGYVTDEMIPLKDVPDREKK